MFSKAVLEISDALGVTPFDLIQPQQDSEHLAKVISSLSSVAIFSPQVSFILIGSRSKGSDRPFSDIDIGITGGRNAISSADYLRIKSAVDDLSEDLPVNVDVINLDCAPSWFLARFDYVPRFIVGSGDAYNYFLGKLDGFKIATHAA